MSQEKTVSGGRKALKVILVILCFLIGLVLLLLLGIRAYFRLSVSEYYRNSEKTRLSKAET